MPWSAEQIRLIETVRFRHVRGGFETSDVERLRVRALTAMHHGWPMPDLDSMALRRTAGHGVWPAQVAGLLTTVRVWVAATPIADPYAIEEQRREEELAALARADMATTRMLWSPAQLDRVQVKHFSKTRRRQVGYDGNDVSRFLESVVRAMREGEPIPDSTYVRFNPAGRARGYDPKEVDDFLAELASMRPEGAS